MVTWPCNQYKLTGLCLLRSGIYFGSFPLTVTVTTMGNRSYNSPLNKAPLRTVTRRGNDPTYLGFWIPRPYTLLGIRFAEVQKIRRALVPAAQAVNDEPEPCRGGGGGTRL